MPMLRDVEFYLEGNLTTWNDFKLGVKMKRLALYRKPISAAA